MLQAKSRLDKLFVSFLMMSKHLIAKATITFKKIHKLKTVSTFGYDSYVYVLCFKIYFK